VAGIAATTTYQGLKCTAVLDDAAYPDKLKISDKRMKYLEEHVLDRDPFHGEWNYTARPAAPQEPEPEPAPGPGLEGLAALAGIADLGALLAAVTVPWQAAREQRLHLTRGHPRTKNSGGTPSRLPFEAIITAAACHLRLRMPYRLLGEVLGAHPTTISEAAARVIPLLEEHGITAQPGSTRISALPGPLAHAAAHGITITGTPAQHQGDTPETAK
jgi:hypothetical protein